MAEFLVRDFDDPKGYRTEIHPSGDLPREKTRHTSVGYVPWGLTMGRRVIYAKAGEHTGWRGGSGKHRLTQYDTGASRERRRLCQSELGVAVLNEESFTQKAVQEVSLRVKHYLSSYPDRAVAKECVLKNMGHYFYTGGRKGFGRISEARKEDVGADGVWTGILLALTDGRLDQKMAIHDAVGRKILPTLGGGALQKYNDLEPKVREKWFDDSKIRGRVNAPGPRAAAIDAGGIAPAGSGVGAVAVDRSRAVDGIVRDLGRTRHQSADAYYDDVDARNVIFGGGISGTTGTLLQAAIAIGKLSDAEALKQYTLAIIGYLVGGGMHSYHETMVIAAKVGVPYNPGGYVESLPTSFTASGFYGGWRQKYYDIVVLGPTHWRFNETCLPSHLNTKLKPA